MKILIFVQIFFNLLKKLAIIKNMIYCDCLIVTDLFLVHEFVKASILLALRILSSSFLLHTETLLFLLSFHIRSRLILVMYDIFIFVFIVLMCVYCRDIL